MASSKTKKVPFERAWPLLERLVTRSDDLLFKAIIDVVEQIKPADVEQAVAWLSGCIDGWPPIERVVPTEAHPALWRLAGVLSIEKAHRGLISKLDRDLSWLQGVSLKAPRRSWVEALLRGSDPSRWCTMTVERPGADGAALDSLAGVRLSKLEALILIEATEASVTSILSWDAPRLESLTLIESKLSAGVVQQLLDHFTPRELALVSTPVDERRARAIATGRQHLEVLEVVYAKLPLAGLRALLEVDWPRLQHLDLVGNRLGKAGIAELVAAQARVPRVRALNLRATQPTVAGWSELAESGWMKQLESLSIGGGTDREIPADVARRFLKHSGPHGPVINHGEIRSFLRGVWLAKTPEELRELCLAPGLAHISFLDLGPAASSCPEVLAGCERLTGVKTLWWKECTLGDDDLGAVLSRMPRLEHLELCGEWRESPHRRLPARGLGDSGVTPKTLELTRWSISAEATRDLVASGLLGAVRVLWLERCRLRAVDLAAILRAAPALRDFAMHKVMVTGASRSEIVDALCSLHLQELSVPSLRLGDDGLLRLLESPMVDGLRSLHVAANRLTDVSALAIAKCFAERAPVSIDASANHFSSKGLAALRKLTRLPFWALHGSVYVERNRWKRKPPTEPVPKWLEGEVSLDYGEFAFAGSFAMGHHSKLVNAVRERSGKAQKGLRPSAGVVVIGQRPGKRKQRAIARGLPLLREERFYELLGLTLEEVLDARIEDAVDRLPDGLAWQQLQELFDRWPDDSVEERLRALLDARPGTFASGEDLLTGPRQRQGENVFPVPRRWLLGSLKAQQPRLKLCNRLVIPRMWKREQVATLLQQDALDRIESLRINRRDLDLIDDSSVSTSLRELQEE